MKAFVSAFIIGACVAAPSCVNAQGATDAYLNEEARELVRLARLRLNTIDTRIEAYGTTARERFSVGLRAGFAHKLVYRRETVTRIDWQRAGPVRMEVLAMREVSPLIKVDPEVPFDLSAELLRLAFDPTDLGTLLRVDSTSIPHPLAPAGEANYRYQAGDTTEIRLPDGRVVRLYELRVIPRRRVPTLISGSFWLDAQTHGVVQAYFKLARAFDVDRDGGGGVVAETDPDTVANRRRTITLGDIPLLRPIRADLDYIAIEYGLWELTWWLPRLLAAQGVVQVSGLRIPLTYERKYDAYTVRGDTSGARIVRPDSMPRRCRERVRYEDPVRDSARQARTDAERARRERWAETGRARADSVSVVSCEREFIIAAASDSALLHSAELPTSVYEGDVELMSEAELRSIVDRVRSLPGAPWRFETPRLHWGLRGPIRYNRIEGLSLGARLPFDLGPALLETEARFGLADREFRGEVALDRREGRVYPRLAAYRRLQPTMSSAPVQGPRALIGALMFGRDDGEYFDAIGGELTLRPPDSGSQWYDLRLYAERQRAVERNTDFSIAHLLDRGRTFRDNFTADTADQLGARLRLRKGFGLNPAAPRLEGELTITGETGDYQIVRPEAVVRLRLPLPADFVLGLEGAAGTVEGSTVPTQAQWWLGGASTLRGYPGSALVGERYWRTRAELGVGVQAARLSLFSDAGWAAPRNRFDSNGALVSGGVGVGLFDGLLRIDVARGFKSPGGWRLHLLFNGML